MPDRKKQRFLWILGAVLLLAIGCEQRTQTPQPNIADSKPAKVVITEKIETRQLSVCYGEQRYIGAALAPNEEVTAKEGQNGVALLTVKTRYENGKPLSQTVLSQQTVQQPTDRIVLYGEAHTASAQTHPAEPTAQDGVLTTPDGQTFAYSRVLSCTATAYSCEGYVGTTAIGTTARIGAVAVDPNYIPYGTKLYIVSDDGAYLYGTATAEDCGNFRGYHIDLYFDTVAECWTFGRRSCTVYILK